MKKKSLGIISFLTSLVLLQGCANPSSVPNSKQAIAVDANNYLPTINNIDEAVNLLSGYEYLFEDAQLEHDENNYILHEVLFYGTIMAVTGSALYASEGKSAAKYLRNVGATLMGGSEVLSSRYKLALQSEAYGRALKRTTCAKNILSKINLEKDTHRIIKELQTQKVIDTKGMSYPEYKLAYDNIIPLTKEFTDRTIRDLRKSIVDISIEIPSASDITAANKRIVDSLKVQVDDGNQTSVVDIPNSYDKGTTFNQISSTDRVNMNEFLQLVNSYEAKLDKCKITEPI